MKTLLFAALTSFALAGAMTPATAEENATIPYPLDVCIVSNEGLESMGSPVVYKHGDREIKFCCRKCLKKFAADPEKYLALIDEAAKEKTTAPEKEDGEHSHHHE